MTISKLNTLLLAVALLLTHPAIAQEQQEHTDSIPQAERLIETEQQEDSDSLFTSEEGGTASIDAIIQKSSLLRTSQLGLLVYDLTADSVIYAYNERQTMRPASTMKLVTAITALDKLGGAYLYTTKLCYTGELTDSTGVLNGDLYCIGAMDPKFGRDDLRAFTRSIKEAGIDTIRGSLYADRSMKDSDMYGEGWCWDDDNPMLSPLVYSRKDKLIERLADAISDAGIVLEGEVLNGKCPSKAVKIGEVTHTIEQILQRMMKDSNNLYAETMFYHIGLTQGRPSTAKKARSVENALLRKLLPAGTPYRIADGSGLSLYNYVSAEILVALLRYAFSNPDIYGYLHSALPIAGVDGTLEKRMLNTPAARNVHAKTGTVSGISSLAGYCKGSNGHDICFAIINQGVMKSAQAKTLQDRICVALCK